MTMKIDPAIIASLESIEDADRYLHADIAIRDRVTEMLSAIDTGNLLTIDGSSVDVDAMLGTSSQPQEEKEILLDILKRAAEARRSTFLWKSYEGLSLVHNPLRDAYKTLQIQKPSSITEVQLEM
jgi:hypothetical protein